MLSFRNRPELVTYWLALLALMLTVSGCLIPLEEDGLAYDEEVIAAGQALLAPSAPDGEPLACGGDSREVFFRLNRRGPLPSGMRPVRHRRQPYADTGVAYDRIDGDDRATAGELAIGRQLAAFVAAQNGITCPGCGERPGCELKGMVYGIADSMIRLPSGNFGFRLDNRRRAYIYCTRCPRDKRSPSPREAACAIPADTF